MISEEALKEIVTLCDGDADKVDNIVKELKSKKITSIEELKIYAFKNDFSDFFEIKQYEHLYKYVEQLYEWKNNPRYTTLYLEEILDFLEDDMYEAEEDKDEEEIKRINLIYKDLMDSKFGSLVFDW